MFKRMLSLTVIVCFFFTTLEPYPQAHADGSTGSPLNLPAPGTMVNLSPAYEPALIKGLTVHKDNPFLFDFIVDSGNSAIAGDELKRQGDRLVKYFFACLTIPEKDLWVNLSPYEKDRMIPQALGQTALGRDLLAQDYILKQLTASLIYPEKDLGKTFWDRVYSKAQKMYGTTQIPVNTFNKVWIVADKASVFEHGQTAFVMNGHLKVMLEEDYLALQKHNPSVIPNASSVIPATPTVIPRSSTVIPATPTVIPSASTVIPAPVRPSSPLGAKAGIHSVGSQIVKEIILPEIEKEVNTGKNFSTLRQIFNSLILASWYKKDLKEALLTQVYADKSTVKGVNIADPSVKEQIYQQYLKAYKQGVFNYIKEDAQPDGQTIPRKYFSGGFVANLAMTVYRNPEDAAKVPSSRGPLSDLSVLLNVNSARAIPDKRMVGQIAGTFPISSWSKGTGNKAMVSTKNPQLGQLVAVLDKQLVQGDSRRGRQVTPYDAGYRHIIIDSITVDTLKEGRLIHPGYESHDIGYYGFSGRPGSIHVVTNDIVVNKDAEPRAVLKAILRKIELEGWQTKIIRDHLKRFQKGIKQEKDSIESQVNKLVEASGLGFHKIYTAMFDGIGSGYGFSAEKFVDYLVQSLGLSKKQILKIMTEEHLVYQYESGGFSIDDGIFDDEILEKFAQRISEVKKEEVSVRQLRNIILDRIYAYGFIESLRPYRSTGKVKREPPLDVVTILEKNGLFKSVTERWRKERSEKRTLKRNTFGEHLGEVERVLGLTEEDNDSDLRLAVSESKIINKVAEWLSISPEKSEELLESEGVLFREYQRRYEDYDGPDYYVYITDGFLYGFPGTGDKLISSLRKNQHLSDKESQQQQKQKFEDIFYDSLDVDSFIRHIVISFYIASNDQFKTEKAAHDEVIRILEDHGLFPRIVAKWKQNRTQGLPVKTLVGTVAYDPKDPAMAVRDPEFRKRLAQVNQAINDLRFFYRPPANPWNIDLNPSISNDIDKLELLIKGEGRLYTNRSTVRLLLNRFKELTDAIFPSLSTVRIGKGELVEFQLKSKHFEAYEIAKKLLNIMKIINQVNPSYFNGMVFRNSKRDSLSSLLAVFRLLYRNTTSRDEWVSVGEILQGLTSLGQNPANAAMTAQKKASDFLDFTRTNGIKWEIRGGEGKEIVVMGNPSDFRFLDPKNRALLEKNYGITNITPYGEYSNFVILQMEPEVFSNLPDWAMAAKPDAAMVTTPKITKGSIQRVATKSVGINLPSESPAELLLKSQEGVVKGKNFNWIFTHGLETLAHVVATKFNPEPNFGYKVNDDGRTASIWFDVATGSIEQDPFYPNQYNDHRKAFIQTTLQNLRDELIRTYPKHTVILEKVVRKGKFYSRDDMTRFQLKIVPRPADAAMRADHAALANVAKAQAFPGGINLNTSNGMQWRVSKDGKGVEMNIDPAMIERVRREGIDSLSPVIFRITPVTSIWPLLGLQAPANDRSLAGV